MAEMPKSLVVSGMKKRVLPESAQSPSAAFPIDDETKTSFRNRNSLLDCRRVSPVR